MSFDRALTLAIPLLGVALALCPVAAAIEDLAEDRVAQSLDEWKEGVRLLHSSRIEKALALFLERKRERPDDPCGYYFPGLAYLSFDVDRMSPEAADARGRELLDEGIEVGERLLRSDDVELAARYCVGAMYGLRAGDRLIRSKYLRAAFDGKKSRRIMLDLREEVPQCVDCRFWLGTYDYLADVLPGLVKFFKTLLFFPGGDKERGLDALRKVAENGVMDRYSAFWMLHTFEGRVEKDPDASFETLRRSYEVFPESLDVALSLAWAYARAIPADRARGIEIHRELLERMRADPQGFGRRRIGRVEASLAAAYLDDLRPKAAIDLLRPLLENARGEADFEPSAALTLVRALGLTGRSEEAVAIAREVAARHPDAQEAARVTRAAEMYDATTSAIANAMRPALRLGREGRLAEAEEGFRALLDEHGERSQIHLGRGEMYFELDRPEEAEASYRKAIETGDAQPEFAVPVAYIRLGNLKDLEESRGEAKALYRRAEEAAGEQSPLRKVARRFLKEPFVEKRPRIPADR